MPLGRLGGRCLCRNWRESPVLAHECAPGASGWPMPVPKLEGITCFGTRMCPWGVWVADARAETACICQFWHTDVPLGRLGGRCPCRNCVKLPVLAHEYASGASGWPMPVPKLRGRRVVCRCRCRSLRKPAATASRRPGLCGRPRQRLPSPGCSSAPYLVASVMIALFGYLDYVLLGVVLLKGCRRRIRKFSNPGGDGPGADLSRWDVEATLEG